MQQHLAHPEEPSSHLYRPLSAIMGAVSAKEKLGTPLEWGPAVRHCEDFDLWYFFYSSGWNNRISFKEEWLCVDYAYRNRLDALPRDRLPSFNAAVFFRLLYGKWKEECSPVEGAREIPFSQIDNALQYFNEFWAIDTDGQIWKKKCVERGLGNCKNRYRLFPISKGQFLLFFGTYPFILPQAPPQLVGINMAISRGTEITRIQRKPKSTSWGQFVLSRDALRHIEPPSWDPLTYSQRNIFEVRLRTELALCASNSSDELLGLSDSQEYLSHLDQIRPSSSLADWENEANLFSGLGVDHWETDDFIEALTYRRFNFLETTSPLQRHFKDWGPFEDSLGMYLFGFSFPSLQKGSDMSGFYAPTETYTIYLFPEEVWREVAFSTSSLVGDDPIYAGSLPVLDPRRSYASCCTAPGIPNLGDWHRLDPEVEDTGLPYNLAPRGYLRIPESEKHFEALRFLVHWSLFCAVLHNRKVLYELPLVIRPNWSDPHDALLNHLDLFETFFHLPLMFNPWHYAGPSAAMITHTLWRYVCSGKTETFEHLIKFMAHVYMKPEPANIAPVFEGAQGTGKTLSARLLAVVLGTHNYQSFTHTSEIFGEKNTAGSHWKLVLLDEMSAIDPLHFENLKNFLQQENVQVRKLYQNVENRRRFSSVMIAANEVDSKFKGGRYRNISNTHSERRFFLITTDKRTSYTKEFWHCLHNMIHGDGLFRIHDGELSTTVPGPGAFLFANFLKHVPLGNWAQERLPKVKYQQPIEQIRSDPFLFFWFTLLDRGYHLPLSVLQNTRDPKKNWETFFEGNHGHKGPSLFWSLKFTRKEIAHFSAHVYNVSSMIFDLREEYSPRKAFLMLHLCPKHRPTLVGQPSLLSRPSDESEPCSEFVIMEEILSGGGASSEIYQCQECMLFRNIIKKHRLSKWKYFFWFPRCVPTALYDQYLRFHGSLLGKGPRRSRTKGLSSSQGSPENERTTDCLSLRQFTRRVAFHLVNEWHMTKSPRPLSKKHQKRKRCEPNGEMDVDDSRSAKHGLGLPRVLIYPEDACLPQHLIPTNQHGPAEKVHALSLFDLAKGKTHEDLPIFLHTENNNCQRFRPNFLHLKNLRICRRNFLKALFLHSFSVASWQDDWKILSESLQTGIDSTEIPLDWDAHEHPAPRVDGLRNDKWKRTQEQRVKLFYREVVSTAEVQEMMDL